MSKTKARDRIMNSAMDLFHEFGVQGVRVDQILKKSDTGKSQFYHYFEDKNHLVAQCLEEFLTYLKSEDGKRETQFADFKQFEAWLMQTFQKGGKSGCPLGRMIYHVKTEDVALRQNLTQIFQLLRARMALFIARQQGEGLVRNDIDPEVMAIDLLAFIQGGHLTQNIFGSEFSAHDFSKRISMYLKNF